MLSFAQGGPSYSFSGQPAFFAKRFFSHAHHCDGQYRYCHVYGGRRAGRCVRSRFFRFEKSVSAVRPALFFSGRTALAARIFILCTGKMRISPNMKNGSFNSCRNTVRRFFQRSRHSPFLQQPAHRPSHFSRRRRTAQIHSHACRIFERPFHGRFHFSRRFQRRFILLTPGQPGQHHLCGFYHSKGIGNPFAGDIRRRTVCGLRHTVLWTGAQPRRHAQAATNPAASSERISPNILVVTTTS